MLKTLSSDIVASLGLPFLGFRISMSSFFINLLSILTFFCTLIYIRGRRGIRHLIIYLDVPLSRGSVYLDLPLAPDAAFPIY